MPFCIGLGKVLDGATIERYSKASVEDHMHRTTRIVGLLAVLPIAIATAVSTADQLSPFPQEWKVTKLTGQIVETVTAPPDMPKGSCIEGKTVFRARAEESSIHTGPAYGGELAFGLVGVYDSVAAEILNKFQVLPDGVTLNADQTGGLFVFSFEFDNGYHTNDPLLDPRWRAMKMGGPLGAASSYMGTWSQASGQVFGIAALEGPHIQADGGTTGLSLFEVNGHRSGQGLSGTWRFREAASLMGCVQTSIGQGTWEAEPVR